MAFKKLRRAAAVLSLTLSAGLIFGANTAEASKSITFPDVRETDWYSGVVDYVASHGYLSGYANGNYGPMDNITRGQFATILYRIAGANLEIWSVPFGDVSNDAYYTVPVCWAAKNGIMTGYSDGNFGPNDPITREQLMSVLYRYAGALTEKDTSARDSLESFPDEGNVSSWARDAVSYSVAKGIVKGSKGLLNPKGYANRAEIASILMNFLASDQTAEDGARELIAYVKTSGDTSSKGTSVSYKESDSVKQSAVSVEWQQNEKQLAVSWFVKKASGEIAAVEWRYNEAGELVSDSYSVLIGKKTSASASGYSLAGYAKTMDPEEVTKSNGLSYTVYKPHAGKATTEEAAEMNGYFYNALDMLAELLEQENAGSLAALGFVNY